MFSAGGVMDITTAASSCALKFTVHVRNSIIHKESGVISIQHYRDIITN